MRDSVSHHRSRWCVRMSLGFPRRWPCLPSWASRAREGPRVRAAGLQPVHLLCTALLCRPAPGPSSTDRGATAASRLLVQTRPQVLLNACSCSFSAVSHGGVLGSDRPCNSHVSEFQARASWQYLQFPEGLEIQGCGPLCSSPCLHHLGAPVRLLCGAREGLGARPTPLHPWLCTCRSEWASLQRWAMSAQSLLGSSAGCGVACCAQQPGILETCPGLMAEAQCCRQSTRLSGEGGHRARWDRGPVF